MIMLSSFTMTSILIGKTVSYYSVSVQGFVYYWFAIVIEKVMRLFISFRPEKRPIVKRTITNGDRMKDEYDLSKMKSRPNPYAKRLKKQVTLRMREDVIDYFKTMAEETGIPYQSLINFYLADCMASERQLQMTWVSPG